MPREDAQLIAAKQAYRSAKEVGNHQEEARWANLIGNILKNRGEYVMALKWFRIDYEVSVKYLPEKQLLATCQSLGEVYLRLEDFKHALLYQKKHLDLAKDSNDIVEQQRASTQLGRTYYEMLLKSDNDHCSVRNAKKYFKSAMKLAKALKEKPPSNKSSFVKEYIDAHNNFGMLQMELDNFEEAKRILIKGLKICDEEEVSENDDGRSRLHHNLGYVYMELRMWGEALEHIEKDIIICKRIGHCQGEAKGFINLGELHYRKQKYEEAMQCYQKALNLAKSMEDEDALVAQINQNIDIVKEAFKVMDELKQEEQNLKKLSRARGAAKSTASERKCLLQQMASLDRLLEKSSTIFAWLKHLEFAKRKKRVAKELCDKEKLGDSFFAIGESYQKVRKFKKAFKWYTKSWEIYKSIGNLEGQALAKINIGIVLDSDGHWQEALNAYEEGYEIAVEGDLASAKLSALENMHYSHMIRFDNIEEARRLQDSIDDLKQSNRGELEAQNRSEDYCSETDTEEEDHVSRSRSNAISSERMSKSPSYRSKPQTGEEKFDEDAPLVSLFQCCKSSLKQKTTHVNNTKISPNSEASPISLQKSTDNPQNVVGRKRVRVVLSDDEDEIQDDTRPAQGQHHKSSAEGVASSDEVKIQTILRTSACKLKDVSEVASKCANVPSIPVILEGSTCSLKSKSSSKETPRNSKIAGSLNADDMSPSTNAHSGSRCDIDLFGNFLHKYDADLLSLQNPADNYGESISFKIDNCLLHVQANSLIGDNSIEVVKVELACLYFLQSSSERRSKGLLPIIHQMSYDGRILQPSAMIDTFKDCVGKGFVEVLISGWVQKRLIKLYVDYCNESSEAPNMKLLKKLYNLEVEDEIIASECELQDISVIPLLNALLTLKTVAMLDLSHNLLGNGTMEKLHQIFTSLGQAYGDFTLDLHCNRFGPTALFQLCECPALLTRLAVLNISGNRLTDACGSYLSTILKNCKALYSLNVERCSVTSRTIQKIADALDFESVLSQLCIGHNNPITGNTISNLLSKLSALKRFSELNLSGLKLSKNVIEKVCHLAKASSLSGLVLGGTGIGTDGALQITGTLSNSNQELVKLDLSCCALSSEYVGRLSADINLISCVLELNIGGNSIMQVGGNAVASVLQNHQCSLRVLVLNRCQLGLVGILHLIQALSENETLEELNLAGNADLGADDILQYDSKAIISIETLQPNDNKDQQLNSSRPMETCAVQPRSCTLNTDYNQLEVADSEESLMREEPAVSEFNDSCTSSCQRKSSHMVQYIQDLSTAISVAKNLQFLDISNNGFSTEVVETLWAAWSSGSGTGLTYRHIEDQVIHFSRNGKECCRIKPCCRKD